MGNSVTLERTTTTCVSEWKKNISIIILFKYSVIRGRQSKKMQFPSVKPPHVQYVGAECLSIMLIGSMFALQTVQ